MRRLCFDGIVSEELKSVTSALDEADADLLAGLRVTAWTWPTGFDLLDTYLGGGLRAGELCLLGGPQGLGKTALALQIARNVARAGGASLVLSYEHDPRQLLERLLAIESGAQRGLDGAPLRRIREALEGTPGRPSSLSDRLSTIPGGVEAMTALRRYGDRLLLRRCLGSATDLPAIAALVDEAAARTGKRPVVVVDYLQKVFVPGGAPEPERVTLAVEGLKDLALELELPVLAVTAMESEGLESGTRLRVHHLRGSSALAYEPDVVLLLNDKYDVVSRRHLVFDPLAAERYRGWAVLSIEKNRSGMDHVDLELRKRFEQSRFETDVQAVNETLIDERVFRE